MTLLFVDSNAPLLESRAALLRERLPGFTVVHIADAEKAAEWIADADVLDVLVTEAIFDTEHTGFSLRDAAHARFPNVRVLFTTRFDLTGFESEVGDALTLKDAPYTVEKLVQRVQSLMTAPVDASEPPPVMVPGTVLGNYQVLDRLYIEREAETYRALQVTVQRPVALVLLKPDYLKKKDIVAKFKERIRVKASLTFSRIAPLYEAGEANGWLFYTRELPRGRTLEELEAAGEHLSERRLTEVLHGITEAMQHATSREYNHRDLAARDVYIDGDHQASITNIFRQPGGTPRDARADVKALLAMLRPVASDGKARGLLDTLQQANHDWNSLLDALDEVRDAMREHSIVKKIEAETMPGVTRERPWWVYAVLCLILLAAATVGAMMNRGGTVTGGGISNDLVGTEWVRIPAGTFEYQKGEKRKLPDFWISKFEVTVGQYDEFLTALKKAAPGQYDHAEQPVATAGHTPKNWSTLLTAAKTGAIYSGEPISLNTPVTQVDWFDAYAYAKWSGARLPTEEEWEKAARGEKGLKYPWGSQYTAGAANLGDDYSSAPNVKGGKIDGHNLSAPVSRETKDVSAYGVCDMAGNVQEWTGSEFRADNGRWPAHPDYPDVRVPVVRGGHFGLKSNDQLLTARFFPESAGETAIARGFRIARDTAP